MSAEPPPITPLTVGGPPALFIPMISDFVKTLGNPKIQDPIPRHSTDSNVWMLLSVIYEHLRPFTPRIMGTYFQNIVLELMDNVDISTVPGVVAGR